MLEMPPEPSKQPCFLSLHESPLGLTKTRVPQTCARALTKPQFWEKSPGTASSTFHFFGQPRKWQLTPLVSSNSGKLLVSRREKRLGVGGALPSGTKDVSAKTAASLLPQVFSQLVAHRLPSAGAWLISH